MSTINVILSGGLGSRLWPLSRKSRPKQYLPIFEGETLFQKTVLRNRSLCEQVLIVGNKDNCHLSQKDLESLGIKDYGEIIEAAPRNTAAAITFAALSCQPDDILFVTPSDQLIIPDESYESAFQRAKELAEEGFIVTFGLQPTRPETGYGYIEADGEDVKSFHEKPDKNTAQEFLDRGNFYWNSGMFCFKASVFLDELAHFEPNVYLKSLQAFQQIEGNRLKEDISLEIPSISVDFAVMERTEKIKVVPAEFEWSDMGSFESIYEYLSKQGYPTDDLGNMVIGTKLHTEFTGLTNTILIQTEDAILVLKKENAQDVKKIYERLERDKPGLV
ncbi:mannose-1-phosphate guanylyltransferase [Shivajiella indica]|uniref:Mannose-1-phosphate guanylyltransferase n=1 Tax=Shivajiella indica TaxID=872115 RepID=A0ABW5B6V9_9BACT